jgi:hypothetical protein
MQKSTGPDRRADAGGALKNVDSDDDGHLSNPQSPKRQYRRHRLSVTAHAPRPLMTAPAMRSAGHG